MPLVRAEVTTQCSDSIPADFCTNVVYHQIDTVGFGVLPVDWDNHADEILGCFNGTTGATPFFGYSDRRINVKLYDMADALPRAEKSNRTWTSAGITTESALGIRQGAVVLSYFAGRNLPSLRGHIYLGPFGGAELAHLRPQPTLLAQVLGLGQALFDVGGANVSHEVFSVWHNKVKRAEPIHTTVTDYWVDNSWDVQRRRKTKATARSVLHP